MNSEDARVFGARFATRDDADAVRTEIEALGYDPREISYVVDAASCSSTFDAPGSHWNRAALSGMVGGGAVGGAIAVTANIGSIALLGPIGALLGAAAGGVSGYLYGASLASDQAIACEKAIDAGDLVMIVQSHAGDSERVRTALGAHIIAVETDRY